MDDGPCQNTDVAENLLHCLTIERFSDILFQNKPISTTIIAILWLFSISKWFWSYLTAKAMLGTANGARGYLRPTWKPAFVVCG